MFKLVGFTLFFLICCFGTFSQTVLKGKVISAETQKPLASVSVYLNNTSLGTITNEDGLFIIRGIPSGKFRLVASSVGFESYVSTIDSRFVGNDLVISLKPKTEELQSFSVTPPDPNGWAKWGKLFMRIFIGDSRNSDDCHLENPEILKFRLDPDNLLIVYAVEPLHIRNYALGYDIMYKLEEFEFNLNSKVVVYNGYTLFKDLSSSFPKSSGKWIEARKDTYQGSLLHFMRAFFINRLEAEGFEMRNLGNISNPEKDRAKYRFRLAWTLNRDSTIVDTLIHETQILPPTCPTCIPYIEKKIQIADSTDYFKKKLLEPDSIISHQIVLADSIGFMADSTTAGLYFPDSLEISYKLKETPVRYKRLIRQHKNETVPVSQFVFMNKKPVYVISNGYYYGPHDLKITGFWAWWETIADMLPFDYKLPDK